MIDDRSSARLVKRRVDNLVIIAEPKFLLTSPHVGNVTSSLSVETVVKASPHPSM